MTPLRSVVIVGGSLAGLRAAETFRRQGFDGRLTVIGREGHRPYDRPPLSKEVLAGRRAPETISLRKPDSWEELEVDWRLGRHALSLDLAKRAVRLDGEEDLPFDGL